MIDKLTNGIAAGAVVSPVWLPGLEAASQVAALLLPIAGLAWLIIQIITRLTRK